MNVKRHVAFQLFLSGDFSLRQIATKVGVGRATIERWSAAESWVLHRQYHFIRLRQQFQKDHFAALAKWGNFTPYQLAKMYRLGKDELKRDCG